MIKEIVSSEEGYYMKKYQQIEDYIINQITSGKLSVGDQILTENELSKKFKISRPTVNKAIVNLSKNGYIKRIAGKGSFVLSNIISKNISSGKSFTEDMASIGKKAGSRLISFQTLYAKDLPEIAQLLQLHETDFIHFFVRVRTGDNEIYAVSYTYLAAPIISSIDVTALSGSLHNYLNHLGIASGKSLHKLSAHIPTEEQRHLLHCEDVNVAVLKNAHIVYTKSGVPFEYSEVFYIGTKYEYIIQDQQTPSLK